MRLSLYSILCATLCSSLAVRGEVSDEREMASPFTYRVSVMWYNDNASSNDCTDAEQTFIMDKMSPNMDFILSKDGYNPIPWSKSRTKLVRGRFLRGEPQPDRELSLCSDCLRTNIATYCNQIYNCGFLRMLTVEQEQQPQQQHREVQDLTTTTTSTTTTAAMATSSATGVASKMQTQFASACTAQLIELSANVMLQGSCRKAVAGSVCQVTVS